MKEIFLWIQIKGSIRSQWEWLETKIWGVSHRLCSTLFYTDKLPSKTTPLTLKDAHSSCIQSKTLKINCKPDSLSPSHISITHKVLKIGKTDETFRINDQEHYEQSTLTHIRILIYTVFMMFLVLQMYPTLMNDFRDLLSRLIYLFVLIQTISVITKFFK